MHKLYLFYSSITTILLDKELGLIKYGNSPMNLLFINAIIEDLLRWYYLSLGSGANGSILLSIAVSIISNTTCESNWR